MPADAERCLTVAMPCYNESATITTIIAAVLDSPLVGHLIIVDDGSTDGTRDLLATLDDERISVILHERNHGKGAALRTAFSAATCPLRDRPGRRPRVRPGRVSARHRPTHRRKGRCRVRVTVHGWSTAPGFVLLALRRQQAAHDGLEHGHQSQPHRHGDMLQGIPARGHPEHRIEEPRFGVEPEITAKIARMRLSIYEVGISYDGRTYEEGKKMGWRDGVRAMFCIAAFSPLGQRIRLRTLSPVVTRLTGGRA